MFRKISALFSAVAVVMTMGVAAGASTPSKYGAYGGGKINSSVGAVQYGLYADSWSQYPSFGVQEAANPKNLLFRLNSRIGFTADLDKSVLTLSGSGWWKGQTATIKIMLSPTSDPRMANITATITVGGEVIRLNDQSSGFSAQTSGYLVVNAR